MSQTSQLVFLYGFRKVQALHDHLKGEDEGDCEGGEGGGDDGVRQIWQADF